MVLDIFSGDCLELFLELGRRIEGEAPLSLAWTISMPANVQAAEENDLKPSIGHTRHLMRRWSCSILFGYWLLRMWIAFKARRDRSRRRLSASQEMIASRLVWLPSMTIP